AKDVLILALAAGTDIPANRYFNTGASTTTSGPLSSGTAYGFVIKSAGAVIDAVGTNSYTFPAISGVTAADFSGNAPALSGNAGTVRTAAVDNNVGTDFTSSATATQSVGTYNTSAGYVPAAATLNYAWTPTANLNDPTISNPTASNLAATTTFEVVATDATTTCADTGSVTVTVGAPVIAAFSANDSSLCAGQSVTLTATQTGGGAPYTYSVSNGSSVVSTTATSTLTPTTTTTYVVTVTDACLQTDTQAVTIVVNALPTAALTPVSSTICNGQTQLLTTTTSAATPSYVYRLNGTVISGATAATYGATLGGTYQVTVTDAATACSTAVSATVNVLFPSLTVTPSTTATTCGAAPTTVTAATNVYSAATDIGTESFNGSLGTFTQSTLTSHTAGSFLIYSPGYTYGGETFQTYDNSQFAQVNSDSTGSGQKQRLLLTSPAYSTIGQNPVGVILDYKYQFYSTGDSAVQVQASTDGTTWGLVQNIQALGSRGTSAAFEIDTFLLPAAYLNQPQVYVRILYASTYGFELAINNFRLTSLTQSSIAWSPAEGLFTDAAATVPYTGGNA
ncbi:MAG TPA: hypothetical protein VGB67_09915, partial [Fibrella sp.]